MNQLNEEMENYFQIDTEQYYQIYEPDNIRENLSLQKLQVLGGMYYLVKLLKTDIKKGLSSDDQGDIYNRQHFFGKNEPYHREIPSIFSMIWDCFEDLMLKILLVASFVSTGIGILQEGIATGWMEGVTILFAIVLIITVTATNNYIKEKQFQKLQAKSDQQKVEVVRDGNIQQIDIQQILVGDILLIQIGDILQTDGIVIEGSEIRMDESSITGESDLLRKVPIFQNTSQSSKSDSPFIISGTKVMDGSGKILVGAVGNNTNLGKIREKLEEVDEPTPLQQKLESIAEQIGYIGTISAGLTMLALFIHLGVNIALGYHCFICYETLDKIIQAFMIAVTIIVVAVPEGIYKKIDLSSKSQ